MKMFEETRKAFSVRCDALRGITMTRIHGGVEVAFHFVNGKTETVEVHPIRGGEIVNATMKTIRGGVEVTFSIKEEVPEQPKGRRPKVLQLPVQSLEEMSLEKLYTLFIIVNPREILPKLTKGWTPKTSMEKEFLANLEKACYMLPPFRTNAIAPSIGKDGKFGFEAGNMPAVGYTAKCYENTCRKVMPGKSSRIATTLHQVAFLGFVMTQLMDKMGYPADKAWHAVCRNSRAVGHYCDSEGALGRFEPTGSRPVGGCSDLGNTGTLVSDIDNPGVFYICGGDYATRGGDAPLASNHRVYDPKDIIFYAVPRIVMEV